MTKYIFKTTATMKPYNAKNWWIAPDIITEKYLVAENVNEALENIGKKCLKKTMLASPIML